ncbi:TPA: ead/Ea22-like family protein [Enterobacter ludwigii]|nr:ead/Ea22-like family protein [Enterobacter ludwigii]
MSNIDKQALRADALEATGGSWVRESGEGWEAICCDDDQGNAGFIIADFQGENATANRKFVQSANPATVLALLDELEAAEKRIAELEAREVVLPQRYSMLHRVDFDEPYHTEMVYKQHQVLKALHDAGVYIAAAGKGEAS